MNTQYEKNSIYLAKMKYRMKRRSGAIKKELTLFMTALTGICAALYLVISSLPS